MTTKGYVFHRDPNYRNRPTGWRAHFIGTIPDGTLKDARAWIDRLIAEHGEDATFEAYGEAEDRVDARFAIERAATEAEVEARKAKDAAEKEAQVRAQRETYERLKAIFEPSPTVAVDAARAALVKKTE